MKFPAFEPIDLKSNPYVFETVELELSRIVPDVNQPRKNFDTSSLEELALSIKQYGIIQPIIVKKLERSDKYQLIAGERRWRASKLAGLEKIPAIIREYDKSDRMAVALIENIQRESLNPLEEAQAIQSLLEECSMTHSQVAESIGKSRATVSNQLRLLSLHEEVKIALQSRLLEMGHARALLTLDANQQKIVAKQTIDRKLSVRETEKLVQKIKFPISNSDIKYNDPILEKKIQYWIGVLRQRLSSKVKIQLNNKGEGSVVIPVNSPDEIEWLVELINSSMETT